MILYGRNMSPFARRVAVWCTLQGRELERRKLTVAGEDFEKIKALNPVGRVPVLVLDDGAVLIETSAIIDWLEETAPEGRRLLPASGLARRDALQLIACANSTAEKGVALAYDKNRRPPELHWPEWVARLEGQITGGLAALEAQAPDGWFGGDAPNGADIAFVIAHDFIMATNPHLLEGKFPKLSAMAERAQALPAFLETMPEV
jgi:glutathione S-transferase